MPYWRFLCSALAFACNNSSLGPMVFVAADAAPAILTPEAAT